MTDAVRNILSNYASQPPGVRANLFRLLNSGRLAGSGKLVILPVDQGFEHGPARSFSDNPDGYDPHYHYRLALDSGCSAYAAPLGFLEAGATEFAGRIPTILKLNNHDSLAPDGDDPVPSVTASVEDALYLGCSAIGFTIYPGSANFRLMYEELAAISEVAKASGLAVVVWSYPRGSGISREGETALDVVACAAQIAAQMGAHIIKVKLPGANLEQDAAAWKYEEHGVPLGSVAERVRHVVQSAFAGRRIVIFSGGSKAGEDSFFEDIRGIHEGGGFGSIIGRNSFQRPREDAIRFLNRVQDIYLGK